MSLYAKKMRVGQCARKVSAVLVETHRVWVRHVTHSSAWHFPSSDLTLIDETRRSFVCGFVAYEWPGIVIPPPS